MSRLDQRIAAVTERIVRRSADSRKRYLDMIAREGSKGTNRSNISCGNLAHGFAASGEDKPVIRAGSGMNIGIVAGLAGSATDC